MCNSFIWIILAWLVLGNNGNGGCGCANETTNGCGCAARQVANTCGCDADTDYVRVVRNNGCGC